MTSFGSLFTGCGGLDLGLEAAGLTPAWACEQDDACVRVLNLHRPGLRVERDVRALPPGLPAVEALAGGFPCQDLSYAGRGAGLGGDRSGLWYDMARTVRELRPRLVLVENVPGLLTRGLHVVLHDLASAGYAGRWLALAAADLGAPHRRERIFVLARRLDPGDAAADLAGGHPAGTYSDEGWIPPQESLLERRPLARLGKRGRFTPDAVYEDDARLALDDDAPDPLLPTPGSDESDPSPRFVGAMLDADVQHDRRLYLPGRAHHSQRTLARVAQLLPTPTAEDGDRGPDYAARDRSSTGDSLTTAAALLPTPTARDHKGSSPSQQGKPECDDSLPTRLGRLLPTPTSHLADRGSQDPGGRRGAGKQVTLSDVARFELLPTPVANPQNPGGGELGAAIAHGPGRRNGTGVDSLGRPNQGRPSKLLPTPTSSDQNDGDSNVPRDGRPDGDSLRVAVRLLPTPQKADGDGGRREDAAMAAQGQRPSGAKASLTLSTAAALRAEISGAPFAAGDGGQLRLPGAADDIEGRLLPTPTGSDGERTSDRYMRGNATLPGATRHADAAWGVYAAAVARWEPIVGRPAPPPVDGRGRLDPGFVEWMLGYPPGYTAGEKRTARLRMLGNSVQVQVGERAGRLLLDLGRYGDGPGSAQAPANAADPNATSAP